MLFVRQIESTDMSKNNKKALSTISKLRGDPRAPVQQPKDTANQAATQLLLNGKNGKLRHKIKLNCKISVISQELCVNVF